VHPRFRTPWITSIVTGLGVAFFSAVFTVREAGSLCSIGTLLAFVIVSVGILVLRVREPIRWGQTVVAASQFDLHVALPLSRTEGGLGKATQSDINATSEPAQSHLIGKR
jgi:hypothetical protein